MFSFKRSIHVSSVLKNSSIKPSLSKSQLELNDYLSYFQTPKDLKPLIYRKRNANELISRDLWDPVAKKRIVPLSPPKIPSKFALSNIINDVSTIDELYQIRDDLLLQLSKKPQYTTSFHINEFLLKSASLRKFPHALSFIYSQKDLSKLLNSDNLNLILLLLYINARKSFLNTLEKVKIASGKIDSVDTYTTLLKASVYLKFDQIIPLEISQSLNESSLELPTKLSLEDRSESSLLNYYRKHSFKYLKLSPVAEQFNKSSQSSDLNYLNEINQFINDFKSVQTQLNKKDLFQSLKNSAIFRRPRQHKSEAKEEAKE